MIDPASEDGEVTIICAITRLIHLSDYQLASVAFIVCVYTLKITVILLNIFNVWVFFFVTHIHSQSLRLHRVHADILPSLRVRAVPSATDFYFVWSNIGLFHVIYKTANNLILCKANQVT